MVIPATESLPSIWIDTYLLMDRYLPLISLVILVGCAGPRTIEPQSRTVPVPFEREPSVEIDAVNKTTTPDLTLDQITLADSFSAQDASSLLSNAKERYSSAINALGQADTTTARDTVDEILGLLIQLSDDEKHTPNPAQSELLKQLSVLVDRIHGRQHDSVELKGAIQHTLNRTVQRRIKLYLDQKRLNVLMAAYQRSGLYIQMIRRELTVHGLPRELQWLPIVESGFKSRAYSWADAAGLWQFIYDTGRRYGLTRSGWVDDRMDPYKATPAALAYLSDLYDMFDDWSLALAAYNCGEMRVLREINRAGTRDFWRLRLPRETRNYVPKFLAVLHILENPDKYGVELPETHKPYLFEEVKIGKSVTLKNVADDLKMSQDELKAMNSSIRYGVTPPSGFLLRVPLGAGLTLLGNIDNIPESKFNPPPEIRKYRVRRGDTLGHIARKYRTSVSRIRRMNRIRGSLIRIGQVLRVPGRRYNNSLWVNDNSSRYSSLKPATGATSHTVRRGDTLIRIARNYATTVMTLKRLNGLQTNTIYPNQVLRLTKIGENADERTERRALTYNIRSGDTLTRIARAFRVSLSALIRVNPNLQARRLKIGQQITIPG